MPTAQPSQIHLLGCLADNAFHQVKTALEWLSEQHGLEIDVQGHPEALFEKLCSEKCATFEGNGKKHNRLTGGSCLIWRGNDEYIGGVLEFLRWAKKQYNYEDKTPQPLYRKRSAAAVQDYIFAHATTRRFAFLDVSVGYEEPKRMIIELFFDKVPRTVENFLGLCDPVGKYGYKGTPFHRVVQKGWVQGGDVRNGDGDGGWSIYGRFFEDENFAMSHTWAGDVAMASSGQHCNGSQFYISCAPLPWLDKKKVVFGRVFQGMRMLRRLEGIPVARWNQRPSVPVTIVECGELMPQPPASKAKPQQPKTDKPAEEGEGGAKEEGEDVLSDPGVWYLPRTAVTLHQIITALDGKEAELRSALTQLRKRYDTVGLAYATTCFSEAGSTPATFHLVSHFHSSQLFNQHLADADITELDDKVAGLADKVESVTLRGDGGAIKGIDAVDAKRVAGFACKPASPVMVADTMVALLNRFTANDGSEDKVVGVFENLEASALGDSSVATYALHRHATQPTQFYFTEWFSSIESLVARLSDPSVGQVISELTSLGTFTSITALNVHPAALANTPVASMPLRCCRLMEGGGAMRRGFPGALPPLFLGGEAVAVHVAAGRDVSLSPEEAATVDTALSDIVAVAGNSRTAISCVTIKEMEDGHSARHLVMHFQTRSAAQSFLEHTDVSRALTSAGATSKLTATVLDGGVAMTSGGETTTASGVEVPGVEGSVTCGLVAGYLGRTEPLALTAAPVVGHGVLTLRSGADVNAVVEAFQAIAKNCAEATTTSAYAFFQEIGDPNRFHVWEFFTGTGAVNRHFALPWLQPLMGKVTVECEVSSFCALNISASKIAALRAMGAVDNEQTAGFFVRVDGSGATSTEQ